MKNNYDYINFHEKLIAIIIYNSYKNKGINFFTPNDFSQQLAYMQHPNDKIIQPHFHNPVKREVLYTNEVLFIKKGKIRADLYSDEKEYICSKILNKGDIILLVSGGHGFEILKNTEMIEIKQGPYTGDNDKTRFIGISKGEIKF